MNEHKQKSVRLQYFKCIAWVIMLASLALMLANNIASLFER